MSLTYVLIIQLAASASQFRNLNLKLLLSKLKS